VSVRLSAKERRTIDAAAAARGEAPSTFLRRAGLRAAGQPLGPAQKRRDALSVATAHFLGLLGRIASSANQLARSGNAGRLAAHEREDALDRLYQELAALRAEMVKADDDGEDD
jgi:uncharacterized protein (DUF1778 family)